MPISGIAGSIAGRGVWEAGRHAYQTAAHWRYAQLFGSDATSGRLHLVVGALVPPACQDQAGNPFPFIFSKPGLLNAGFSTSVAIPSCEVRAAKYLAESVAMNARQLAILTTDVDIASRVDLSFVSFGIMSNLKTGRISSALRRVTSCTIGAMQASTEQELLALLTRIAVALEAIANRIRCEPFGSTRA
jgi:hypothetical protein